MNENIEKKHSEEWSIQWVAGYDERGHFRDAGLYSEQYGFVAQFTHSNQEIANLIINGLNEIESLRDELTVAQKHISNLTQLNELKTEELGDVRKSQFQLSNLHALRNRHELEPNLPACECPVCNVHRRLQDAEQERDRYKAAFEWVQTRGPEIEHFMRFHNLATKASQDAYEELSAILNEIRANENLNSGKEV